MYLTLLFGAGRAGYQRRFMPILFLIVFVDLVGFGLVIPLLPFYAERFGASPLQMTLLFATYSLMAMLAAPLWGRLSDRVGRRPVLMASMAAASLAYLWLAFADTLWMLFAARAVAGVCAGNIAAAQAYVADVTTPEGRARGMGMIGAAFGFGFIIGPVLGGILAGDDLATADLQTPALMAGGLSLAAFFLVILAFSALETTFAWWAIAQFGWGPRPNGFVFFYVGLLSALIQGVLIGPLTRRFGEERLMLCGLVLIAVGFLMLPLARNLEILVLAMTALALGIGLTQPSVQSLISRHAAAERQGEVLGLSQSVGALSRVLGPLAAGALFEAAGRNSPFLWGAVLVAGALLVGWRLPRGLAAVPPGVEPPLGPAR
jgi:DHA1 family tetracycline resistance protein-like MFS transporter